jgi:methionyl-tRNA synthetase
MTSKLAREIFDTISDTCAVELYMDLIQKAVVYAHIRAEWALADEKTQSSMRAARTAAHNAFIASTAALASAMAECDESASWMENIGNDRQESAEFACWIHYHLSMEVE